MPRAKQRTPQLRDHVLAVAIATLGEEGIARFTTRLVAERAGTSVPAVYELFGDKAGLVRAMFFEGFRRLGAELAAIPVSDDPLADLERVVPVFRRFCRDYPRLAQVMFSRPFADFEPGPEERAAGAAVREVFVGRIQRCVDAGLLAGDVADIAHALLALAQGLAVQELGRWLGSSAADVERRWRLGVRSLLDGFSPAARPRDA
jgi:AcrR family transcriptional regulator